MQLTNCTSCKPLFHCPYELYGSCSAIHGSYLFDSVGQECFGRIHLFDNLFLTAFVSIKYSVSEDSGKQRCQLPESKCGLDVREGSGVTVSVFYLQSVTATCNNLITRL